MNGAAQAGSTVTAVFLVLLIHVILAWDVYAGLRWGPQSTVSWVVNKIVEDRPILAVSFGVFIGHVCWPLR